MKSATAGLKSDSMATIVSSNQSINQFIPILKNTKKMSVAGPTLAQLEGFFSSGYM